MLQQSLNFRRKCEQSPVPIVVEGLDAQRSRAQNSVLPRMSQMAKANMPRKCAQAIGAVLLISMNDGFGIGASAVGVTSTLEGLPEQ